MNERKKLRERQQMAESVAASVVAMLPDGIEGDPELRDNVLIAVASHRAEFMPHAVANLARATARLATYQAERQSALAADAEIKARGGRADA